MPREKPRRSPASDFVNYLVENPGNERIPTLAELSQMLGVGIASLREQLEVARVLGMVEVRPKTGIKRLPFSFTPAVQMSAEYAIEVDPLALQAFLDLRDHIEAVYWYEAVGRLTLEDHDKLQALVVRAREKLSGQPVQIPHDEHRELHMTVFSRIGNPFVLGFLEAFWELYESKGLNIYGDLDYLEKVWDSHEKMVSYIVAGNLEAAYQVMIEHKGFLYSRAKPARQQFE